MEDSVTTSSLNQTDFRDNSEGVNVQGKSILLSKQSTIEPRHKKNLFLHMRLRNAADQCLCYRYIDRLPKFEISSP